MTRALENTIVEAHIPSEYTDDYIVESTHRHDNETVEGALARLGQELTFGRSILTVAQRVEPIREGSNFAFRTDQTQEILGISR